jgi:hypothetical protein
MFTALFWKSSAERAVRTAAQVLLGFLVVGETGVLEVDWAQALSVSAVAVVASVLTSVVATGIGDKGTASLVKEGE